MHASHLRTSEQDTHTCNILLASLGPFVPTTHSGIPQSHVILPTYTRTSPSTLPNPFICVSSFTHSHTRHSNFNRAHPQKQKQTLNFFLSIFSNC